MHWPLNGPQLIVFMLAPFIAIPLTSALLSGIAGYTVGVAWQSENNRVKVAAKGLLLYAALMLAVLLSKNMMRTAVIAATLLGCVRYFSRRTE